jgi:cobalt/nickel transport system permease protein
MHMADALLSPAVGGTMWAVTAGTLAWCAKKVRHQTDDRKIPLMGVLGAFLFAAQMINFSIPATGSSGHLGGGLLLAVLLGPHAAFLVIASVLVVQALFFADGGLLALGCNVFNMGFIPAFVVYPFIYRKIAGTDPNRSRLTTAIMISAVATLQLGSFSVVAENWCSGISALPFSAFLLLMQPVHLAIGVAEGFVTVAVVSFVRTARPEILQEALEARPISGHSVRGILLSFLAAAILMGGVVSWFASKDPDGLEWAIARATGKAGVKGPAQGVHGALATLQEATSFLPDYSFRKRDGTPAAGTLPGGEQKKIEGSTLGTGFAGVIGGLMTLVLVFLGGCILKRQSRGGVQPRAGEEDGIH